MKRISFVFMLIAVSTTTFAQLKVSSDGTALLGSSTHRETNFSNSKVNLESYTSISGGKDNVAIQGTAYLTTPLTNNKAVGVFGIAGNGAAGHNMGVLGYLGGSKNGAGVFGTYYGNFNYTIPGMYAGFFNGEVYATGKVTGTSFVTTSDLRLKENVTSVSESEGSYSFLDRVLDMNVIEYNLKDRDTEPDTNMRAAELKKAEIEQRHIGLAAQELQKLFPELVVEGQDGYLAVNYIELVPVLIRSIQELKQELDETKDARGMARRTTDITESVTSKSVLYQNTPNPFTESTTIRFELGVGVNSAAICIFDMSGKMLKKIAVSSGQESVTVNSYEFGEGMFLYSLIVNGQEIDTKKMIISK